MAVAVVAAVAAGTVEEVLAGIATVVSDAVVVVTGVVAARGVLNLRPEWSVARDNRGTKFARSTWQV